MILTGLKVVVFFCKENFRRRRIFSKKTRKSSISYLKMCLLSIKTFFFRLRRSFLTGHKLISRKPKGSTLCLKITTQNPKVVPFTLNAFLVTLKVILVKVVPLP